MNFVTNSLAGLAEIQINNLQKAQLSQLDDIIRKKIEREQERERETESLVLFLLKSLYREKESIDIKRHKRDKELCSLPLSEPFRFPLLLLIHLIFFFSLCVYIQVLKSTTPRECTHSVRECGTSSLRVQCSSL